MKQKTNRLHFSTRTLAMVLSIVMLIGSIATGSMLSTFAAYLKEAAANSDAVSQAASEGSDIALNAIPSDEDSADDEDAKEAPDLSRLRENSIVKRLKQDLTATGANADLAASGSPNYISYGYKADGNLTTLSSNKVSGASITFTSEHSDDYYFVSASDDGNYYSSMYSNAYPGYSYSGFTNNAGGNGNNNHSYNDGKINWVESYNATVSGIKLQVVSGTTVTVTYNNGVYEVTATSGGGTTPTVAPTSAPTTAPSSSDEYYLYGHQFGGWSWDASSPTAITKMNQDSSTGYYYYVHTVLNQSDYYRIWNGTTNKHYGVSSDTQVELDGSKQTATQDQTSKAFCILTGVNGTGVTAGTTVVVWYDATNKQTWITSYEETHDVTFSAGTGGSISPSGSVAVGESTATTVTATADAGYAFSSWSNGSGITQVTNTADGDNQTQTITTESTGDYTVQANFTKKSYTVSYDSASNGSFTVTKAAEAVASGTSLPYQTGLTVTCTPDTGYEVDYVKVNDSDEEVTLEGNTATFLVPAADAEITVAFKKSDLSISKSTSPAGKGTITVSKTSGGSNTTTYQVGDTLYLSTSVSDNAYTVSSYTLTYGDGTRATIEGSTGNTGAIDATHFGTTGAINIVANLTKKPTHSITVVSNDKTLGKATSSIVNAYSGQRVDITATEETGTFSAWSKSAGAEGTINSTSSASTYFTMGNTDVILTATFNTYSADSNFYYNGYNLSGDNASAKSGYYGKRMKEAMISGEKYSYYHVTGRTETDQLFTVSYGNPDYSSPYVYFEVPESWNTYGSWSVSEKQGAYFLSSDHVMIQDWTEMTGVGSDGNGNYKWKTQVPDGARYVFFKGWGSNEQTLEIDLRNGDMFKVKSEKTGDKHQYVSYGSSVIPDMYEYFHSANHYTNNFSTSGFTGHNANLGGSHAYAKPNSLGSDKGDYYILVLYNNKTYNINGDSLKVTKDPEIIWVKSLPTPPVEPDGTTRVAVYAKNGTLRSSVFNRFTNLANTDFDTTYFSYSEKTDSGVINYNSITAYNAAHPDYQITYKQDQAHSDSNYAYMTNVPVGAKIKLKTTLNASASTAGSFDNKPFKDTHYLKAYSFNGMTYELHEPNTSGVYEEIWTVRAVNTYNTDTDTALTKEHSAGVRVVEVTPIYYMKDDTNTKTFYIDGYDGTVQQAWGNMLAVYPYYENKSNAENAFGGYPGQPMLYWGGKYQMQIPLTVDGTASGATVKGLTLHNGYWDLLHRDVDLVCNEHAQTYDFDDFYKIYKEKNPDSIIFDFKYRNTEDNYADGNRDDYGYYKFAEGTTKEASDFIGSGHNGVELLTDYYGRQVDVFGNVLSTAQATAKTDWSTGTNTKELLLVSNGYKHTYTGWYATMYAVYAPVTDMKGDDTSKKFIGYITPSMLYLNNVGRISQYAADNTGGLDMNSTDPSIKATYNHLKSYYSGVPAVIVYEKEILNDSRDKAKRSDGKWYYSKNTDQVTAQVKIQYVDGTENVDEIMASANRGLNSGKWTDEETYTAGLNGYSNVGSHTGCSAYFTNTSPYLLGKVDSGKQFTDTAKYFNFTAKSTGNYMFVGWVRQSNGKLYAISENEDANSNMSSNDVYIARFVKTSSGTLTVSHNVQQTSAYTGTGTPNLTVTVLNGSNEEVFSETVNDGSKIDVSEYINSKYAAYKIRISLSTTPDVTTESMMEEFVCPVASGKPGYITATTPASINHSTSTVTATIADFTVASLLEDGTISSLNYVSHLSVPTYTYQYQIKYNYTSRFWGEQSYTVNGEITNSDIEGMQNIIGSKNTFDLKKEFIIKKTPFEKNLRQSIKWLYDAATHTNVIVSETAESKIYKVIYNVTTEQPVDDSVTAEFKLPYSYDSDDPNYVPVKIDAYNGDGDNATKTGTQEYVYDDRHETVSITTKAYSLFTTDSETHTGGDDVKPSYLSLIEAAPYIRIDAKERQVSKVTTQYFTGTQYIPEGKAAGLYFVAKNASNNDTCYWYQEDNIAPTGTGYSGESLVQLKSSDVVPANTIVGTKGTPQDTDLSYAIVGKFNGETAIFYVTPANAKDGQYQMCYLTKEIDGYVDPAYEGAQGSYIRYFTRWDVYDTDGDYVTSTYSRRFNLSGYEDYLVEAIYESETEGAEVDPEDDHIVGSGAPTITYIGDSRNQWNNDSGVDGSGNLTAVTGKTIEDGDVLFHDFAISYDFYGEEIATSDYTVSNKTLRIGMLIEKLDALDVTGDGAKILDSSYYADKYKSDYKATALSNALKYNSNPYSVTGHPTINSKIGNNRADGAWGKKFDFSVIDNMNRLQWYYTFDNTKTEGEIGSTNNANFVYRATAYLIEGSSTVYLSSTPIYFTLYDSARR